MAESVRSADKSDHSEGRKDRGGRSSTAPVAKIVDAGAQVPFQKSAGNLAMQRLLGAGVIQAKRKTGGPDEPPDMKTHAPPPLSRTGLSIQRAPVGGSATTPAEASGAEPKEAPAPGLIVDDSAFDLAPGQMKRSEFMAQLRSAVCRTVEEALAGTFWSAAGCPYIDRWLGYYGGQDARHIEQAVRRFAPEAAGAAGAADYIPLIAARVRSGIATWRATGEVSGVPAGVSLPALPTGMPGSTGGLVGGLAGAASGLAGVATGLTGGLLFKRRGDGHAASADPGAVQARLGPGRALDGSLRSRMEPALGANLDDVRVHTDAGAAGLASNLQARAFTVGQDVAFGAGQYRPGTPIGDALIAHELAHVVQQRGGGSAGTVQRGGASYAALEEEADLSAVGAVAGMWGGLRHGMIDIAQNAMPRLRSGLRLQRCKSERQKEIERLAGLQFSHLEEKRKKLEEEKRKEAAEAAKKRGEEPPKVAPKVDMGEVLENEVKKSGFTTHPTDAWKKLSDADKEAWKKRAKAAWDKVMASIKGTELENVMVGKSYNFDPLKSIKEGYYAWQDNNALNFGMSWVKNAEADPKNAWPNLAHEMGGHYEYGKTYASEIMAEAIKKMPEAEQKKWTEDEDGRQKFYLAYEYPETEIYSAVRELRYADPVSGTKPTYGGLHPYKNVPQRLNQMKDTLHPDVAKAVLKELKKRIDANPQILERDRKYFVQQVEKVFGYKP